MCKPLRHASPIEGFHSESDFSIRFDQLSWPNHFALARKTKSEHGIAKQARSNKFIPQQTHSLTIEARHHFLSKRALPTRDPAVRHEVLEVPIGHVQKLLQRLLPTVTEEICLDKSHPWILEILDDLGFVHSTRDTTLHFTLSSSIGDQC